MSGVLDQLVVVPDLMSKLAIAEKYSHAITGLLADNECRHGRLPSDRTPPCGCWPEELPDPPAPVQEKTTRLLFCENGSHHWTRPRQRGRLPLSCPAHPHNKEAPTS